MPNNEFGDFQTPAQLAEMCLRTLGVPADARLLEPTCGRGAFLRAAARAAPESDRLGVEIQPDHAEAAKAHGRVRVGNLFQMRLSEDITWKSEGPLFIIGNPPWVTSSELTRMDSANLPAKGNFKGARGVDAILGSSNFDVGEYIILKLLQEFRREPFTLGMLCKTQVARNVVEHAASAGFPIAGSTIHRIDAMRWFNAAVDACWFTVRSDPKQIRDYTAAIHEGFDVAGTTPTRFGVVGGRLVSDVSRYELLRSADGVCPFNWRSGLKHDAAAVFELTAAPEPTTRDGVVLDVESGYLLPLLKGTDVFRGRHTTLTRWVIVPQRSLGDETRHLKRTAPKLWAYLDAHGDLLDNRKSSIYRNRPRFSVFGHGDYTYAPYKVAVSGLHKQPVFRLVAPIAGRPVVLDDTCYFLPFENGMEAAVTWALLDSQPCRDLIESLVFWDSKRPLGKKLLARLDLNRLPADHDAILTAARREAQRRQIPADELPPESALTILDRDPMARLF